MKHNIQLIVNNNVYEQWQEVTVSASMEALARTFSLKVIEQLPKVNSAIAIRNGDACTLLIDGEVLVTGFVNKVDKSYDHQSHSITVSGRDKTGDLVDCSYDGNLYEWNDRNLQQIISDICAPYGIKVILKTDIGANFKKFRIEQGERCIESIDRLCRHRGVLRMSDGQGNLVITKSSTKRLSTPVVVGKNVKSCTFSDSQLDIFSRYVVKGQNIGDDNIYAESSAEPQGIATDSAIRHRTTVILAEDIGNNATYAKRAYWEAIVRRARSQTYNYTLDSWKGNGQIWQENKIVKVEDPLLGIKRDMLVSGVEFTLNSRGFESKLNLVHPKAFDLLPEPEKEDGSLY